MKRRSRQIAGIRRAKIGIPIMTLLPRCGKKRTRKCAEPVRVILNGLATEEPSANSMPTLPNGFQCSPSRHFQWTSISPRAGRVFAAHPCPPRPPPLAPLAPPSGRRSQAHAIRADLLRRLSVTHDSVDRISISLHRFRNLLHNTTLERALCHIAQAARHLSHIDYSGKIRFRHRPIL